MEPAGHEASKVESTRTVWLTVAIAATWLLLIPVAVCYHLNCHAMLDLKKYLKSEDAELGFMKQPRRQPVLWHFQNSKFLHHGSFKEQCQFYAACHVTCFRPQVLFTYKLQFVGHIVSFDKSFTIIPESQVSCWKIWQLTSVLRFKFQKCGWDTDLDPDLDH